jgi:hypothetical protein
MPHSTLLIPSAARTAADKRAYEGFRARITGNPQAAREVRQAQRSAWAKLHLRQDFADEAWLRGHLRMASIRVADLNEPASVRRMRTLLRRAELRGPVIQQTIECSLERFLWLNPSLPLWAAVAMVLEATGRFTPSTQARTTGA